MPTSTPVFVYEYLSGGGAGNCLSGPLAELLEAGKAMRDALIDDFRNVDEVVVTRATSTCAHRADSSARLRDVAPDVGESAAQFVSRHARAHDVTVVVAPETDGILATLRQVVPDARWLGCSAEAIAIASSKSATRRHLAAHGIDTSRAWEPGHDAATSTGGWVVKPDDGAGCVDTLWFERFEDARAEMLDRVQRGEATTMESWVEGEPLSLSLLCNAGHAEVLSINRQQVAIHGAREVRYDGVAVRAVDLGDVRARALVDLGRRVGGALPGLQGFVGIDVVDDPQRGPVVIEVNPRITCAYVGLSAALGRNLARDMLELLPSAHHHAPA